MAQSGRSFGMTTTRAGRVGPARASAGAILGTVAASLLAVGCLESRGSADAAERLTVPVPGGTLRLSMEVPAALDPSLSASVYESLPVNQLFDGLVAMDASLSLRPALARAWSLSPDGRTYRFELREDATFHDGEPVTASDVAFTIRRQLCPRRGERTLVVPYLEMIDGAKAFAAGDTRDLPGVSIVDPRTVEIRLERPYPMFLEVLAVDGLKIVPRHVVEQVGDEAFGRAPVGTGPFRFASWDDDRLVLEANRSYFGRTPLLDRLELLFYGDEPRDGGAARFYAGDVDLLEPSNEDLPRLAADARYELRRYQELSLAFLGFSAAESPMDRLEVRQAIAHAIDRAALVAQAPVVRREAVGILPPGMLAYSPDRKALAHDPPRARALLARAGYGPARPVPPVALYTTASGPAARKVLESVRSDLDAVGILLEVRTVPWTELTRRIERGTAPAFLLAWVADMNDPDAFLRGLLDAEGSGVGYGLHDAESAALLEVGLHESSPPERTRTYRELESRVLSRAPLVPLYHSLGTVATRKGVHGVEPGPMGLATLQFENVWIERGGRRDG
jgi:ABC-type transport system substrate-binding protein